MAESYRKDGLVALHSGSIRLGEILALYPRKIVRAILQRLESVPEGPMTYPEWREAILRASQAEEPAEEAQAALVPPSRLVHLRHRWKGPEEHGPGPGQGTRGAPTLWQVPSFGRRLRPTQRLAHRTHRRPSPPLDGHYRFRETKDDSPWYWNGMLSSEPRRGSISEVMFTPPSRVRNWPAMGPFRLKPRGCRSTSGKQAPACRPTQRLSLNPASFSPLPNGGSPGPRPLCGAGGLSSGFQSAGFQLTSVDLNPDAPRVFEENGLGDVLTHNLATTTVNGGYDVVVGGPPCKPWSSINTTVRAQEHRDATLLSRFFLHVKRNRPRAYLLENVPPARPYADVARPDFSPSAIGSSRGSSSMPTLGPRPLAVV